MLVNLPGEPPCSALTLHRPCGEHTHEMLVKLPGNPHPVLTVVHTGRGWSAGTRRCKTSPGHARCKYKKCLSIRRRQAKLHRTCEAHARDAQQAAGRAKFIIRESLT
jgi:hypothetical protein